jgi:broad specificity phosphatase PhoE
MAAARIVFLRHAQGTHNATHAYLDPAHKDAALTTEGVRQAWRVRESGRLGDFDAIFCSPLRRCRQTLSGVMPTAERFPVRLDDRLMEPQGVAICNRRTELADLRSQVSPVWCLDGVMAVNPYDLLSENGEIGEEGYAGFERRVREFTEEVLHRQAAGSRVLVVAHHHWIRAWFHLYASERGAVNLGNCDWAAANVPVKS